MRKLFGLVAILSGTLSTFALAQVGPRDGTNNVASERIGMPGGTSDAVTEYQNRRALNNLPGQQDSKTLAQKLGPARPAKVAELAAGATVNDNTGTAIATIDKVDPDGVVVSMGAAKVKIPTDAFGHNKAGLLLDVTKAQFEQIVAKANAP